MSKDNVVEFPYDKIRNPLVERGNTQMDTACTILEATIIKAVELGYTPTSYEHGVSDYGVILNLLCATICRADGDEHFMHEMMDEISDILTEMKDRMKDDHN